MLRVSSHAEVSVVIHMNEDVFPSPQARGRGRAEDSSYTLVAEAGSGVAERESVNEYREKMMSKAIAKVCKMNRADYEKKVRIYFKKYTPIYLMYNKHDLVLCRSESFRCRP